MSRELVALREVASTKGRSWATERYLRRLVAERRIPFHRVGGNGGRGGKLLVDVADLDAFAEAGRIEPPAMRRNVTLVPPARPRQRSRRAS